jgi:hypothetical protein
MTEAIFRADGLNAIPFAFLDYRAMKWIACAWIALLTWAL